VDGGNSLTKSVPASHLPTAFSEQKNGGQKNVVAEEQVRDGGTPCAAGGG
jgi:hypothetical protein